MRKKGLLLVLSMAISGVLTIPAFAGNWVSNGSIWEYYENGTKTSNRWIQSGDGKSCTISKIMEIWQVMNGLDMDMPGTS